MRRRSEAKRAASTLPPRQDHADARAADVAGAALQQRGQRASRRSARARASSRSKAQRIAATISSSVTVTTSATRALHDGERQLAGDVDLLAVGDRARHRDRARARRPPASAGSRRPPPARRRSCARTAPARPSPSPSRRSARRRRPGRAAASSPPRLLEQLQRGRPLAGHDAPGRRTGGSAASPRSATSSCEQRVAVLAVAVEGDRPRRRSPRSPRAWTPGRPRASGSSPGRPSSRAASATAWAWLPRGDGRDARDARPSTAALAIAL